MLYLKLESPPPQFFSMLLQKYKVLNMKAKLLCRIKLIDWHASHHLPGNNQVHWEIWASLFIV